VLTGLVVAGTFFVFAVLTTDAIVPTVVVSLLLFVPFGAYAARHTDDFDGRAAGLIVGGSLLVGALVVGAVAVNDRFGPSTGGAAATLVLIVVLVALVGVGYLARERSRE
jgi:FtsH-binding integral membrane protein